MDLIELIKTRRTIRLFENRPISRDTLVKLLDAGRCAPSGANQQPVEFVIVDDKPLCEQLFEHLAWAAYVKPRRNPPEGKRPKAYIVAITDPSKTPILNCAIDAAAAIENILLAAWAVGIGSCWLGSIDRDKIKELLAVPDERNVVSVIALGYPAESPKMEDMQGDSVQYYLDDNDTLHVPKRKIKDIGHANQFGIRIH